MQITAVGKFIISSINANGFEHLRIFGEAIFLETRFGVTSAPDVAALIIELSAPARVFPRRSAKEDALGGKGRGGLFHLVTVEGHFRVGEGRKSKMAITIER